MSDTLSRNIIFIVIMLLVAVLVISNPSFAAAAVSNSSGLGKVDSVLQSIVNMMTGSTARLIAIICVAAVGIGWMSGFIDLRKAAYCILGIGIVFGAPALVGSLMGGT